MRKNGAVQLLESFEKKELSSFHQFISSDYFNKDTRLIHLFELLKKYVLHKNIFDDATQTKIYQSLFSDIDSTESTIDPNQKKLLGVRMSLLGKLAKKFLVVEALEEDLSCEIKLLNKKLLEKKQYDLVEQLNHNYKKRLNRKECENLEYYTQSVQLNQGMMNYYSKKNLFLKEDNFHELIQHLDLYYLISKLRIHITMKSVVLNNSQKQYDFDQLNNIATILETSDYSKNPLIVLYLTAIELMNTNEEQTYQKLTQQLDEYGDSISKVDLTGFYTVASNYCSQQIRKKGQLKYIETTLSLYKTMERKQLLVEGKVLQINKLANLVNLSCQAGDYKWANELVQEYYHFIPKQKQQSTRHLLLGIIFFSQKNYEEALSHLTQVKEIGMPYDLLSRTLRLKSTYEVDQSYSFYTMQLYLSVQSYIRNKKIFSKERKKSYENFIRILINLYKVKHKEGRITRIKVQEKLDNMELISNKKWLMDKIAQL